jgi:hypothetical protein
LSSKSTAQLIRFQRHRIEHNRAFQHARPT